MRYQAPRGTEDVLPENAHKWIWLESTFRELTSLYGYREIRTPTFEDYELFARTSGDTSDVVSKEMYDFVDKGGRHVALKPEGTAPVMRAIAEHNLLAQGQVLRLSYIIASYRYGRPQKGRLRELHQCGLELVGSASAEADAEIIEATVRFFRRLGIRDIEVLINSIGRAECRAKYREVVLDHFGSYVAALDAEGQETARKNPLRLLDTKDPNAGELKITIPPITDYLEEESRSSFESLKMLLDEAGIRYRLDPSIVRGLDYYTDTVFEIQSSQLGSQNSLCGGGRYDGLLEQLGGPSAPAVGVGIGIERLLLVLDELGAAPKAETPIAYIVRATPEAAVDCRALARDLRAKGISAVSDLGDRSMKSQLKAADRAGAKWAIIIGDDERAKGVVTLRDLATSQQREVPRDRVASEL